MAKPSTPKNPLEEDTKAPATDDTVTISAEEFREMQAQMAALKAESERQAEAQRMGTAVHGVPTVVKGRTEMIRGIIREDY